MKQTHVNIFYTLLWIRKKIADATIKCLQVHLKYRHAHLFCFRELKVVFLFSRERNMCHRVGGIFQIMISDLAKFDSVIEL